MTNEYEDAKRIVREHEEACLAEFKAKLDALTSAYADVPRAKELAWSVRQHVGLNKPFDHAAGLRLHLRKSETPCAWLWGRPALGLCGSVYRRFGAAIVNCLTGLLDDDVSPVCPTLPDGPGAKTVLERHAHEWQFHNAPTPINALICDWR